MMLLMRRHQNVVDGQRAVPVHIGKGNLFIREHGRSVLIGNADENRSAESGLRRYRGGKKSREDQQADQHTRCFFHNDNLTFL